MKKILLILFLFLTYFAKGQTIFTNNIPEYRFKNKLSVGIPNSTALPTSVDFAVGDSATTRAMFIPRVQTTSAITTPRQGMVVYSISDSSFYYRSLYGWRRGITTSSVINDLADVNITSPTNGQGLVYQSGEWVNQTQSANPTASVGLTAVNGTATTFMRSDAAPALSQSIVPTWSGVHTFLDGTMKLRNVANTFNGVFTNTNTADRTYTLKDANGTIAFVSDLTGGTVTSFSAGTLSPLFTTSVATATTTPALSFILTNAPAGTVFGNDLSTNGPPYYAYQPVLGGGGTTGTLGFRGLTSGLVTIQPQAAAGTYNFNLPTTAGTAGQVLTSQGGGATAMTWTTLSTSGIDAVLAVGEALTANRTVTGGSNTLTFTATGTPTIFESTTNQTNSTQLLSSFVHSTSGTAANDFGGHLGFQLENAAGGLSTSAHIANRWTDATAKTSRLTISLLNSDIMTEKFVFQGDGRIYGLGLHNSAGAVTGTTNQYIASGTYTPGLTNVTNVAASTAYLCQWIRVGNVVTVSGKVDIDATGTGATELGIALPIASAMTVEENLGGTASSAALASLSAAVRADATNDRAAVVFVATSLTNDSYFFTFTYLIK